MTKVISIFSIGDGLGGAEQILREIAKFFANTLEWNVVIFFVSKRTNNKWEILSERITVVYLWEQPRNFIVRLRQKVDVSISSHLYMNGLLGILRTIKILQTNKLIVRESTSVFSRYSGRKLWQYKLVYLIGYRHLDGIITQTDAMKKVLVQQLPYIVHRTKVFTIPNPFVYPDENITGQTIFVKDNYLISAGRLIPEKGFDILIQAFKIVLEYEPSLSLIILGEGKEKTKLEELILRLGLSDKVTLLGFVDNVYPYFNRAKACIVSSRREGFPNVLLQMMSQNENVVSTLCAGGIDKIEGVVTCRNNDVGELSRSIIYCLNKGTNNGNRQKFDSELLSRSPESFIKSLLSI